MDKLFNFKNKKDVPTDLTNYEDLVFGVEKNEGVKSKDKEELTVDPAVKSTNVTRKIKSKIEPKLESIVELRVESVVEPRVEPKVEPKVKSKVAQKVEPIVTPKVEQIVTPKVEPIVTPKVEPIVTPKVEQVPSPKDVFIDTPKVSIPLEEVKKEMKYNLKNLVSNILSESTKLNELRVKLSYKVDDHIVSLLETVLKKSPETFDKISNSLSDILNDGKLDLSDLPKLILLVAEISNIEFKKVLIEEVKNSSDIIELIKFIFQLMIELNFIKVDNVDKYNELLSNILKLLTLDVSLPIKEVKIIKEVKTVKPVTLFCKFFH